MWPGKLTTEKAYVEIPQIVRDEISSIGYNSSDVASTRALAACLSQSVSQSPDIAAGVDRALEVRENTGDVDPLDLQGAGDQASCLVTPVTRP